jgi:hypothetical protein
MTELIIGREGGVPKEVARLAIQMDGKTYFSGAKGSVPGDVSKRHCKISLGDGNTMTVEDITENNILYVNGIECKRKGNVSPEDRIELGPGKYLLDMEAILKALSGKKEYSIKHLEAVYEGYQKEKFDMQVRQGKLNALSALPGVLSMTSIGLAAFFENVRVVMIIIAAIFAIVFALIRYVNASKVPQKNKEIEDRFRSHYVCPNSLCNHFMGMVPYKELLKNKACPYCKCKFKE